MVWLLQFTIFTFFTILPFSLSATRDAFDKESIGFDIGINSPDDKCDVSFGSYSADLGNEINANYVENQPSSVNWHSKPDGNYTIALIDLDAPSRKNPEAREWRHWLVINVRGTDVSKGDSLSKYKPPSPPSGSGPHRYVLLIFEQQNPISQNEEVGDRANWKVRDFASKNNLRLICGNFFLVKVE